MYEVINCISHASLSIIIYLKAPSDIMYIYKIPIYQLYIEKYVKIPHTYSCLSRNKENMTRTKERLKKKIQWILNLRFRQLGYPSKEREREIDRNKRNRVTENRGAA